MSEEEKKAIEWLKDCEEYWKKRNLRQNYQATTLLNLIEKQQNEIEEKTTILLAGAEKVKQLEKEIEELKIKNIELTDSYNKAIKETNEENRQCMLLAVENQDLKEKIDDLKEDLSKKVKALDIAMSNPDYICKDKIREIINKSFPDTAIQKIIELIGE